VKKRTSKTILLAAGCTVVAASALVAAGCGGGKDAGPVGPEAPMVTEARLKYPTVLALHEKVIARSCTPTNGVCHNQKEYPDLHTPGNFVTIVSKPCNEDKIGDPSQFFDGCEPKADELSIPSLSFRTRIGSMSGDLYAGDTGGSYRQIVLEKPAVVSGTLLAATFLRNGGPLAHVPANITVTAGSNQARLEQTYNLDYQTYLALNTVVGGDPNADGVFGAESPWHEVSSGRADRSYLLGRITGTVPGSRMPLANVALSDAEYVAFFCWVETVGTNPSPDDAIHYDACDFARHPVSYQITP
jgi:hypothetical protein